MSYSAVTDDPLPNGDGTDETGRFDQANMERTTSMVSADASPESASQVLALICPDWRVPSFAIDCETGELAYANWKALRLFRSAPYLAVKDGRLTFEEERHDLQFYATLRSFLNGDTERQDIMLPIEEHALVVTIALHSPIGLFREVLVRSLRRWRPEARIVVAEITVSGTAPDPSRIAAFAEAFGLDCSESKLVELIGWGLSAGGEHRGMLPLDARRTLRTIMTKTGCVRPSQLVRLIAFTCRVN